MYQLQFKKTSKGLQFCVATHIQNLKKHTEAWRNSMQISIEDGKILEISGQLKHQQQQQQQREGKPIVDWRRVNWWEHGYVRRLELPEDADWPRMEVSLKHDMIIEIKIPKSEINRGSVESKSKDSDQDA